MVMRRASELYERLGDQNIISHPFFLSIFFSLYLGKFESNFEISSGALIS